MITKFDIDLVPHIKEYSAYVYRITITFKDGTKRIYIGGHKGSIYDSYDFSSKDEEYSGERESGKYPFGELQKQEKVFP